MSLPWTRSWMVGIMPAVAVVGALVAPAHAEDAIAQGAVVKIEQQEIYVSVGVRQGAGAGAQLRVKRALKLRHPVTRAPIEDWLPVGSATITQAGASMSRAVIGELVADVKVGDLVEVYIDRPDAPAPALPPVPQPTPGPAAPAIDPATAEVVGVFAAQTGQGLDARIAGWERFLSTRPGSPYADAIRRDLDGLRGLREQLRPATSTSDGGVVATVQHLARTRAPAGAAIPLVFVLDQPSAVASAFLHYRPKGARTYRRVMLARENDIYLRGAIPADVVAPPGVDYFVEVSTPTGRSGVALGTPAEPLAIEIAAPTLLDRFGAAPGMSSVRIAADYQDFATFDDRAGDRTDRVITATVDFTYRLPGTVQSVGVGYGVFAGRGGSEDQAWTDASPLPRTGFHYGYADVELGIEPKDAPRVPMSFGGKLIAGVGKDGFGLGIEGRFRIGSRDGTNLLLAARTIEEVGFLSDIRFGARPAKDLMIGISVGATNQPIRDDVGVRLGTELEWVGFGNISLILRGSWQGRSVDHGGVGAGGGVGFYW